MCVCISLSLSLCVFGCPSHLCCTHAAVAPKPCCVNKVHKETKEPMDRRKIKKNATGYHCTKRTLTSGLFFVILNQ